MEIEEPSRIFDNVLSAEEWTQIPSDIAKKLQSFVEDKLEEFITAKAIFESKKTETEQNFELLQNELATFKTNYEESESKLEAAQKTITELESQVSSYTIEVANFHENCNRLESSTAEFRHQRNLAIDERDNLTRILERRNIEIDRLQSDVTTLTNQLNTAVNAKCEAQAKLDEISSLKVNLDFRERHFEQEKVFMTNQLKNITEDLNKRNAELQNLRHEHTTRLILLETKLTKKSEELRLATENIASLTSTNKGLTERAEELAEKLKKQREVEIKMQESFNNELLAQTRLAELYKSRQDENDAQVEELRKGIVDLQNIIRNASDQYGVLETKHKESEAEHEEIVSKKNECITMLKKELDTANEMLKLAKEESLHREIENISPSAATASRILKSGTSLTQIYSQYVNVLDELTNEKNENRRLNAYIEKIVQEFEDKKPLLQKEREQFEEAVETLSTLTKVNEGIVSEMQQLRDECSEAKKTESRALRENERMKKEISDLSRQVCFLLKEVEASRTDSLQSPDHDGSLLENVNTSAEIISKKLVTFSNLQELQSNNQKLLALVRELSSKQEDAEYMDAGSIVLLKEKLSNMRDHQSQMLLDQERQNRMLESVIRQRDMYKSLCQKSHKMPLDEDVIPMDQSSNTESENMKSSVDLEKDKKFKEIEDKLLQTEKELNLLKDEYETYKKERSVNEKIVEEQLEKMRQEHRELVQANCKLSSFNEYHEERFKTLKKNIDMYKTQITLLEEKNKTYNTTIIKHEQSIMHLKDEVLKANSKLSHAEVTLQNLQQEHQLLRDSESRLLKEKEIFHREAHGQSLLLTNLELIKASFERSEAEGKIRLENRLEECLRESSALRRRLQEEQDKFRELSSHLERQTQNAQTRMGEEKQQADYLREELAKTREELANKSSQIEELSKKIKNSILLSRSSTDEQHSKEVARQLNESQEEIQSLKQQLALAKESISQYCNIAESAEKELKEELNKYTEFKESAETQLNENASLISELKEKVSELETELSLQSSGQAETTIELKNQLTKTRNELQISLEELLVVKESLDSAKSEIRTLSDSVQATEDKYAREMMLHSSDLQALASLKEELMKVSSELNEVRHEKEQAIEALNLNKAGWEEREKMLLNEKVLVDDQLKDLNAQNTLLHDQIQALTTQLLILNAQQDTSLNQSVDSTFNKSLTEDEVKSSEQLLKIIKYLRKEKDLALMKFDVLQAENLRLKSQYEMIEKELNETRSALTKEREGAETSLVTATKHAEVLRQVETLNAITDSNKVLRDERNRLKMQLNELNIRATSLEEQLTPLQDKNRELSINAESALSENQALRAEATRWRQRANALIEKSNKFSPEDWRRLQAERENLAKMLSAEKEVHRRNLEELNSLKQEKSKLEDQISNLSLQNRNQTKEMKKLTDDIANVRSQLTRLSQEVIEAREIAAQRTDENTKITEDLASKDVMLTDIRAKETQVRKIAKKYKTQYEELVKTVEEEKRKNSEKTTTSADLPPELQESLRDEGRREIKQRITDMEKLHTDKLNELNNQVTSSQEENENLKKENMVLKNNEAEKDERTKMVLKAAKIKITELTEERNKIRREATELKARLESSDQSREAKLEKEKADERQQERDRYIREIEALNQRINQMQRVGLLPASKTSTSSGSSDKSGSDPPTANIKPMSGQQQSATVMPWRGSETPFASIRPMSQLRTVAVLPTSQNTSGSSSTPSTAVLVPPQQQIVHTTGTSSMEVMSSSPTSSHTDYMPATSSASPAVAPIRQVVVPPTQQATIGMSTREDTPSAAESTQDVESETENQPPSTQQQQQTVAMVLPRVEQQSSSAQTQSVEQSSSTAVVASSQQASSSSTVTTTQAGLKRPRETEGDSSTGGQNDEQPKMQPQTKRTRTQPTSQEVCQVGVTESGVEVEYQVPTSSQRDQEDDVIVLSEDEGEGPDESECPDEGEGDGGEIEEDGMMEADDDVAFEVGPDGDGDGYEIEAMAYEPVQEQELVYDDADCNDMEDSEPTGDREDGNNEVEIIDDSSEVPNQSGSSSSVSAAPEQSGVGGSNGEERNERDDSGVVGEAQLQTGAPQSEAISSGSEGTSGVTLSQAAPSGSHFSRSRTVTPLSRQQQSHLILPFEEIGDDGIVPSTPTLYVPRRTDGFGEAVSSPHVPSGRFTFSDTSGTARGAGIAQAASEGADDARVDLSQLDDSGTGRSVPNTPLQVSPQGEQSAAEGNSEVGASIEGQTEQSRGRDMPDIEEEAETSQQDTDNRTQCPGEDIAGTSTIDDSGENNLAAEEGADGVSSEGEKPKALEDSEIEEGREAEATQSSSINTRLRSAQRGTATARRSNRIAFRNRTPQRPTPIVWNAGNQQDVTGTRSRGIPEHVRGNFTPRHRARRMRQLRGPFERF